MRQSNFGGESLGAFKMIDLLKTSSLEFESVPRFGGVQEVEGIDSVVVGVIKVWNWIFDIAVLKKSVAHILVLTQNCKDLFSWIELGIFFSESFDGLVSSHIDLLLR